MRLTVTFCKNLTVANAVALKYVCLTGMLRRRNWSTDTNVPKRVVPSSSAYGSPKVKTLCIFEMSVTQQVEGWHD
jgi:hypothetical protein